MRRLTSPAHFYDVAARILPYLVIAFVLCLGAGSVWGLYFAPPDYQQGEGFRIIYVHVPAAFWSLGIYTIIFFCSILSLVWRLKLADVLAKASAPIGASFTFIALLTGAVWGKPMWGTWWVWDARLTSELILLFLYLGYMGLRSAIQDLQTAARITGIFAVVGMVDIPIVHFSVEWWQTLHQGPTLAKFARPSMAWEMLYPLYLMIFAFALFYLILLLMKARNELLRRAGEAQWVRLRLGV